jgi:NADH oxidase (H2O2-forming)
MARIVVIGGGAAGTTAASTAKQTDPSAAVTLIAEFEDIAYSPCGIPYVFGREVPSFESLFLQNQEHYRQIGIDLRTSTVADGIDLKRRTVRANGAEVPFDRLILCTGWEYEIPNLPGVDLDGIHYIKNIRRAMELDKVLDTIKRVVVWKARPLGVELAGALAHRGLETHLIDDEPWLFAEFADPDFVKPVQDSLVQLGAKIHLGTRLLGFKGENGRLVAAQTSAGAVPCDLAFLVANMNANTKLARVIGVKLGSVGGIVVDDHMRTNIHDVYAAGSCVEVLHAILGIPVRLLQGTYAVAQGRIAGANAAGGNRTYQPVYMPWGMVGGTVQVGGVLVSETLAKAVGRPYIVGQAEGITAARYHPAMEKMKVKLLADPWTHQVIGAQFVGGEGVKERADFMAFAMRKGATLEELATMENVYSPPIGALNEPIALAAQAGLIAASRTGG